VAACNQSATSVPPAAARWWVAMLCGRSSERRGAKVAAVPFSGRAGDGGGRERSLSVASKAMSSSTCRDERALGLEGPCGTGTASSLAIYGSAARSRGRSWPGRWRGISRCPRPRTSPSKLLPSDSHSRPRKE
jgi:hypothetical protein